jgi:choline dehydrogenase-like flavoprotein
MEIDAGQLPEGETLEADLCIVGSGPAGIAIARALRGSGLDVILVEGGGRRRGDAALSEGGETAPGSPHPPADMYRERRFGGSSTIWGGRCVPLDPIDFEARDHVPGSGWPIPHEALAPYYPQALELCEAGTGGFGPEAMRAPKPLIEGFRSERFATAIERYSPPTDFGRRYAAELRAAGHVRLLLGAVCAELMPDAEDPVVSTARCIGPGGKDLRVRARAFVVAAGGIETVRLLAASRARQEAGMANGSGTLGRHYMCHLEGTLGAIRLTPADRPIDWDFGRTRDGAYARQQLRVTPRAQREAGLLNTVLRIHHPNPMDPSHGDPVLSTMYLAKRFILPEYRRKITSVELMALSRMQGGRLAARHVANVLRGAPRLAAFLPPFVWRRYAVRRRIPYVALRSGTGVYALDFNAEQAPNPQSRIEVLPGADRFGLPRFRIDWRLTEGDVRAAAGVYRLLARELAASGVGELVLDEGLGEGLEARIAACGPVGGHHIGTARMSADPRRGVVDAEGRAHELRNLYLAGSATFPTCGHANPTLTIVALSLRLADHLRARLAGAPEASRRAVGRAA